MSPLVQILSVLGLGLFWGLSPTFYRLMGDEGIPITHIIVMSGTGVGLGLATLNWARGVGFRVDRRSAVYGLVCGLLLNLPFALSLFVARKLPVSLFAVITSTSPFWSYGLALLMGREGLSLLRVLALAAGFLSSAVLILGRGGFEGSGSTIWALVAFGPAVLYAIYNVYTSIAWPKGVDTLTAGALESFASAVLVLPLLLLLDPVREPGDIHLGYWTLGVITLIWVVERVCYFTLIRHSGSVTTAQAVYVATPASVLLGAVFFNEPADAWLWASLALLMLALWLNNRAVGRSTAVPA